MTIGSTRSAPRRSQRRVGEWDERSGRALRVVSYDLRGPRFTETCVIEESPFVVGSRETAP